MSLQTRSGKRPQKISGHLSPTSSLRTPCLSKVIRPSEKAMKSLTMAIPASAGKGAFRTGAFEAFSSGVGTHSDKSS